ncbi:MAG: aldo/keto reductase [Parasporobacterium sp.]|nr:aldo/keto reductase [Parasporobacterium sp.]
MEYAALTGINNVKFSRLIYGTGNRYLMEDGEQEAFRTLDDAWEAGFRVFDTAHSYGNAEKNFGNWMESRGLRQQLVIIDKGCNPGQQGSTDIFCGETIRCQLEESLARLKTEQVDYYILHRDDPSKPVDEIMETLNDCKAQGKMDRFGASNWSFARIREANDYAAGHGLEGFSAVSPNYCLADYVHDPWGGSVSLSGAEAAGYRAWLEETELPVFNYSSLGRGYLSGKFRTDADKPIEECLWSAPIQEYDSPKNRERLSRAEQLADQKGASVSQICLKWLLMQKMNLFPIVSPTSKEHIREIADVFRVELSDEEARWLQPG